MAHLWITGPTARVRASTVGDRGQANVRASSQPARLVHALVRYCDESQVHVRPRVRAYDAGLDGIAAGGRTGFTGTQTGSLRHSLTQTRERATGYGTTNMAGITASGATRRAQGSGPHSQGPSMMRASSSTFEAYTDTSSSLVERREVGGGVVSI